MKMHNPLLQKMDVTKRQSQVILIAMISVVFDFPMKEFKSSGEKIFQPDLPYLPSLFVQSLSNVSNSFVERSLALISEHLHPIEPIFSNVCPIHSADLFSPL
jgi:hypothetical protein